MGKIEKNECSLIIIRMSSLSEIPVACAQHLQSQIEFECGPTIDKLHTDNRSMTVYIKHSVGPKVKYSPGFDVK